MTSGYVSENNSITYQEQIWLYTRIITRAHFWSVPAHHLCWSQSGWLCTRPDKRSDERCSKCEKHGWLDILRWSTVNQGATEKAKSSSCHICIDWNDRMGWTTQENEQLIIMNGRMEQHVPPHWHSLQPVGSGWGWHPHTCIALDWIDAKKKINLLTWLI